MLILARVTAVRRPNRTFQSLFATNSAGAGQKPLTLTVTLPARPVITSTGTATAVLNDPFAYQITAANDPTSYGAIGLPAGLGVNTSTGLITGAAAPTGTVNVTLSATNAGGTGTKTLLIAVNSSGRWRALFGARSRHPNRRGSISCHTDRATRKVGRSPS